MTLVGDLDGLGRTPGPVTKPDEPLERIFLFWFTLVPSEFVGSTEEKANTTEHRLKIVIDPRRLLAWDLYDAEKGKDLAKIAVWIGNRMLEKRMAEGVLQREEVVPVHTENYGEQRPHDLAELKEPVVGAVFELNVERRIGFK